MLADQASGNTLTEPVVVMVVAELDYLRLPESETNSGAHELLEN